MERFGYSEEKDRQVITSSQLAPRKNIESIILIYSKLIKQKGFEDIKMLIAGDGISRKRLEDLVEKMNLQKHVIFCNYSPPVRLLDIMSYCNKSKKRVLIVFSGRMDNRMKLTK
ncbi:MAG: glycosyltransferase, partial [Tannerella sp.]|nr:glycosyltransferase [Tannerella sp.]